MKNGKVFIIPNGISEEGADYNLKQTNGIMTAFGLDEQTVTPSGHKGWPHHYSDPLVQVWWTDGLEHKEEENYSENWTDHGVALDGEEMRGTRRVPYAIPLSLIVDKKEGDILKVTIHGHDVEVVCQQAGFRHASHGTFEEVLQGLLDRREAA